MSAEQIAEEVRAQRDGPLAPPNLLDALLAETTAAIAVVDARRIGRGEEP